MNARRSVAAPVLSVLLFGLLVVTAIGQPAPPPLEVPFIRGPVPLDADQAGAIFQWAAARTVPLIPQKLIKPFGGGTVNEVRLRAVHDGRMIYVELTWRDGTRDLSPQRQTAYTDAVALQFPVRAGVLPNPFMGDRERPVNIWQWKAAWQDELTRARDLRAAYPAMAVDYYYDTMFLKEEAARRTFNAGTAAGNLLSEPKRTSAVEDLVAWGFGTLASQPRQDVVGFGSWRQGRWTVLLARPLRTEDPADVQFSPRETTYVNFAVWDGGNADRDGQKNVTLQWWPLRLAAAR